MYIPAPMSGFSNGNILPSQPCRGSIIITVLLREKLNPKSLQVSSWEAVKLSDAGVQPQHHTLDTCPPAVRHGLESGLRIQAHFYK